VSVLGAPFIHCRGMTRYVSGGPGARHSILQEGSGKAVGEFDRFFGHSTRQGIQTKTKYRSVLVQAKDTRMTRSIRVLYSSTSAVVGTTVMNRLITVNNGIIRLNGSLFFFPLSQ